MSKYILVSIDDIKRIHDEAVKGDIPEAMSMIIDHYNEARSMPACGHKDMALMLSSCLKIVALSDPKSLDYELNQKMLSMLWAPVEHDMSLKGILL